MADRKVVLVTGGSGFLGQHIVRELQDEDFDEIRVLDLRPFENKLDYEERLSVKSCLGDVRRLEDLQKAVVGVHSVIHAAAAIDVRMFPDMKLLEDVNVLGTANVISACIAANVLNLIYTSSVDAVVGFHDIVNGDESLPYPEDHLFKEYGTTKQKAEELVLAANGRALARGGGHTLRCVIIRPTVMYGECDPFFITSLLKSAKKSSGTLYRIGSGNTRLQCTYAGNVAWAHICASKALDSGSEVAGQIYTISDDTPVKNTFDTAEAFLQVRGFRTSSRRIPYRLIYGMFYVLRLILLLLRRVYEVNMSVSLSAIQYTNQSSNFSYALAEKKLHYQPKYKSTQSMENSLKFYGKVSLT